ncbi:putative rhamnogalacturonate lyase C, partial [Lachnellula suecica]
KYQALIGFRGSTTQALAARFQLYKFLTPGLECAKPSILLSEGTPTVPDSLSNWSLFRQKPARFLTNWLYQRRATDPTSPAEPIKDLITIVCISDTHNTQPALPDGDLLLHAGDLSQSGSFQEIQLQLDWLNSQPHKYKALIGGNHDLLLDPEFVDNFPQRILERPCTSRSDLKWGKIIYLNNNSVKLDFANGRSLNIYGSPLTKQFGTWAFQYPPIRDVWTNTIPLETDILLTHGPPKGYLDTDGLGSEFLLQEISHVRPRLVVFGHIHGGYGKEAVRFDGVQKAYDGVRFGEKGFTTVIWMAILIILQYLTIIIHFRGPKQGTEPTMMVNAAAVGGYKNQFSRPAITVEI